MLKVRHSAEHPFLWNFLPRITEFLTPLWRKYWFRQLTLIISYLSLYYIIRHFQGNWPTVTALRFIFLLFLPYRYWFLIAASDVIGQSQIISWYGQQYGFVWAFVSTVVPVSPIAMPIIWLCREKFQIFPNRRLVNFKVLLSCVAVCSLLWGIENLLISLIAAPNNSPYPVTLFTHIGVILDKYVAIVAILPWVLIVRTELASEKPWSHRLRTFLQEVISANTIALTLVTFVFIYWMHVRSAEDTKRVLYLAVLLPFGWLTLRPGWRSAALGTTPAIFLIASLMNIKHHELTTVLDEAVAIVVVTCSFLLGARISARELKNEEDRHKLECALQLAKQALYLNEARMLNSAEAVHVAGTSLQLTQHQLLDRVHGILPDSEVRRYYSQAASLQEHVERLVDSLYPSMYRAHGLCVALNDVIANALSDAAIDYHCHIKGDLQKLNVSIRAAVYRLTCESLAHINTQLACSRMDLRVRSGRVDGHSWIVLRIEGWSSSRHINDALYDTHERDMLGSRLGACGLGLIALRNHARLFGGELRSRIFDTGMRLTYSLIDTNDQSISPPNPRSWIA